jgi:hypothetical protein
MEKGFPKSSNAGHFVEDQRCNHDTLGESETAFNSMRALSPRVASYSKNHDYD